MFFLTFLFDKVWTILWTKLSLSRVSAGHQSNIQRHAVKNALKLKQQNRLSFFKCEIRCRKKSSFRGHMATLVQYDLIFARTNFFNSNIKRQIKLYQNNFYVFFLLFTDLKMYILYIIIFYHILILRFKRYI